MATRGQKIYLMHRAMFGFGATMDIESQIGSEAMQKVELLPTMASIEVETSLGRKLTITVNPFQSGPAMVKDYVWDKKEQVYVVVKGSKRPKVERETFSFDHAAFYSSAERKQLRDNVGTNDAMKRQAKAAAVDDALLANILRVLPDAGEYLDVTDDEAAAFLKARGWTFSDKLSFKNFVPGNWTVETNDNYRCSAGRDAMMNFQTKTIETMGWSSDD